MHLIDVVKENGVCQILLQADLAGHIEINCDRIRK